MTGPPADRRVTMLNPLVRTKLTGYAEAFAQATPFRHVVIDDFLLPAVAEDLLQAFPGFADQFALNEMGQVGGKAVRERVRDLRAPYPALDAWLQTADFLQTATAITGIADLCYDPDYVGGGTHENIDGQSLDMHIDFNFHPGTRQHRRLNLIIYLNHEWDEAWGGSIELAEDPWDVDNRNRRLVRPLFNRAVIFETTECSWHGFSRIKLPADRKHLSRRSFAIYLYTRERPPEQTAPSHATVYVPEARPPHLLAGHALTERDQMELDNRFAAARGQLRYLYEREKAFARQIENLEYALREARAAARLEILGFARQVGAAEGFWPDSWSPRAAQFTLELVADCRGAIARIWVPEALGSGFELHIDCNDASTVFRLRGGRVSELRLPLRARAGEQATIRFRANQDWIPGEAGSSSDQRALAFRLLDLTLQHE